jgi:hypothetical protein
MCTRRAPLSLAAWAAACALAVGACAPRLGGDGARAETFEAGGHRLTVVYEPEDAETAAQVMAAVKEGVGKVTRFASLHHPVTIAILPTHDALEEAIRADGLFYLRAWARYDRVDLQSPRSWPDGSDPGRVRDLVVHELIHCALYQTAGGDWSFDKKGIPEWFQEGMAMVASREVRVRPGLWELAAFYEEADRAGPPRRAGDPVAAADPLATPQRLPMQQTELVYGASKLAFQFLLDRYGDERVRAVPRRMREGWLVGTSFDAAFREVIGISPQGFLADFRRYVVWRGWDAPIKAGEPR